MDAAGENNDEGTNEQMAAYTAGPVPVNTSQRQRTRHARRAVHYLATAIGEIDHAGEPFADAITPALHLLDQVARNLDRISVAGPNERMRVRGRVKQFVCDTITILPVSCWRPVGRVVGACWPGFRDA